MKKQSILIIILFIVCFILSISLIKVNLNKDEEECLPNDILAGNFNSLNYLDAFEVSDFADKKVNTIDIAAKNYVNGNISIADSSFRISDSLLNDLYDMVKSYGALNSFYIVSLDDGMSIGYNVDSRFETASSIKAPYALYVYKEIAKGNIDGKQKIAYLQKHLNPGTGVVKNSDFGTEFTVRDLVYYSLNDSDNVAHIMLHNTFGVNGYNEMLRNLGANDLYLTSSNPWGFTSARSAALIWQEIYNFAITESEGITFLNILSNGKYNYFKEVMPTLPSASKTGFASKDVIETGIVFGDHPYIAIAMANKGGNVGAYTQILKLINGMNNIMNEYEEYVKTK